jgi:hypothetical protein
VWETCHTEGRTQDEVKDKEEGEREFGKTETGGETQLIDNPHKVGNNIIHV